jgi:DNA-binding MarR family transcriptional regulator
MPASDLIASAMELCILAAILGKRANRDLELRLAAGDAQVSALQVAVLLLLSHHESNLTDVSRRMNLAPATLVPVIEALARKQLIRRGADPNDRRRTPLTLTPAGRSIVKRFPVVTEADGLTQSLIQLGTERCEELLSALRQVVWLMSDGGVDVITMHNNIWALASAEMPSQAATQESTQTPAQAPSHDPEVNG